MIVVFAKGSLRQVRKRSGRGGVPKLKNISNRLCIVPLPGTALHLAPGEATRELDEFEVRDNPALDKLLSARVLTRVESVGVPAKAAPGAGAKH